MGAAAADAKKMAKAVERILMSGRSSEKERIIRENVTGSRRSAVFGKRKTKADVLRMKLDDFAGDTYAFNEPQCRRRDRSGSMSTLCQKKRAHRSRVAKTFLFSLLGVCALPIERVFSSRWY
jgi:hypothetical protein